MKKIALLLLLALFGCSTEQKKTTSGPREKELTVIATTDFHAALDRAEGLFEVIRSLREKSGPATVHLDGGDLFQGSLEGNLSKGRAMVQLFNLAGLDAAAMGNHELDYGPDVAGRTSVKAGEDGLGNLKARAKEAQFDWLSVNFVKAKKPRACLDPTGHCNALGYETIFNPHMIYVRGGVRVCVIGATTPETPHITNPDFIRGTKFLDLKTSVKAEADHLRKDPKTKCDYVILTTHAGLLCDEKTERCLEPGTRAEMLSLLNALPKGTLDAVVAGHTHLKAQEVINGTPVIEAGWGGKQVGVLHLWRENGATRSSFDKFVPVPADGVSAPQVSQMLAPYRESAATIKARPVGSSNAEFKRVYHGEHALGNLIADALLAAGKKAGDADFSMINAGGIRNDLPAGPLNYGDVFKVLPFDNALAIVELKGADLRRTLEIIVSGGHGLGPVAGLKIKRLDIPPSDKAALHGNWLRDLNNDGKNEDWERNLVLEITDNSGKPIEDQRRYKLATLDFLIRGGDHQNIVFDRIPVQRIHYFPGIFIRDIVVDFIRERGVLKPEDYFTAERKRVELVHP